MSLATNPKIVLSNFNDEIKYESSRKSLINSENIRFDDLLETQRCFRCKEGFLLGNEIVQCGEEQWHPECFLCAQCFLPFPDGLYYEMEGRKYCERDFQVLYAPCCRRCGCFVYGRVIKAMGTSWHTECFRCENCNKCLADDGFVKAMGKALCHQCNQDLKMSLGSRRACYRCHLILEEEEQLKFRGNFYHPYHFKCSICDDELTVAARERDGELICLRCHDKTGISICGACRRPIEERVVHALGKAWHVEHFVCFHCEKPFHGSRHFEMQGKAYCEVHYQLLFGELCQYCHQLTGEEKVASMGKVWCAPHFFCIACDRVLTQESKFYEFDLRPICNKCYEKFPKELRKRLAKIHKSDQKS